MVPGKGLEPSRLAALAPRASVSANSTTRAKLKDFKIAFINFQIFVLRFESFLCSAVFVVNRFDRGLTPGLVGILLQVTPRTQTVRGSTFRNAFPPQTIRFARLI
jgi:hypothetical protein